MYSLRARYYDPATGRFLSRDTWPLDTFNPVELNRYQYGMSNPVTFGDPSGYSALAEFIGMLPISGAIGLVTLAPTTFGVGGLVIFTLLNVLMTLNGGDTIDLHRTRTETDAKPYENMGNETYKPEKNPCKEPSCKNTEKPELDKTPKPEPYRPPVPGRGPLPFTPEIPDQDCDPTIEDCEDTDDCEQNPTSEECDNERYVYFFTVQSQTDALRLRTTGAPWPTDANRAALGPGVYSWDNLNSARIYLPIAEASLRRQNLGEHLPLVIMRFRVRAQRLQEFRQLDIDSLPDEETEEWMERHSLLWGGTPNHSLEYIRRGVREDLGKEHYFASTVFRDLQFDPMNIE